MKNYKIYDINDKELIKKLILLDSYKLLVSNNYSRLTIEVDYYEKKAFINTKDMYIFLDYLKTTKLLKKYNY